MSLTLVSSNKRIWSFVAVFVATLVGLLLIFSLKTAQAVTSNERVVTIHDTNLETTIVTRANTVAEVLKQAKFQTSAYDNVDPSLDTKLTGTSYQINIYRAQPVMVIDGVVRKSVMTAYETPSEIAKDADLNLYDEDEATLSRSSDVLNSNGTGLTLTINRATRFTLMLYGKLIETGTRAPTVGQMLKEKSIKLAKTDTVTAPLATPITSGIKITIWREGVQTITEDQSIAFSVQQIQDANQPIGYRQIRTVGIPGKKTAVFEVDMRAGVEIARREIQSVQTIAPHAQVEVVGTKSSFSGSFSEALARLRSCEGGYTSINYSGGYYGAYQFDIGTWGGYQGYPNAAVAPPAVQDQKAWETYQRRGWNPWPSCSRKLGLPDIYR